jgi:hypothetical protein
MLDLESMDVNYGLQTFHFSIRRLPGATLQRAGNRRVSIRPCFRKPY